MVLEAIAYAWNKYRPQEGWLSPFLLMAVIIALIGSVLTVEWVPEDNVIIPTAIIGLLFGIILARRPVQAWTAWTLIIIYGCLITTVTLSRLWPPLYLLLNDWSALRLYWLGNGALFLDRAGSWFTAVATGSRSNETIIFAFIMGLLAWFLSAYSGWSAFRQRRPLLGLTLMGLVVAINGYYGEAPIETVIAFVGVALLATAVLHFANLEWKWQRHDVDYSREIRVEMFVYAAGIGLALLALAYFLPALNPSKLARTILGQPAVASLEETLDRAFGGVAQPRGGLPAPGQAGGAGVMPRSFLLGNAPELEKNIMLTAETKLIAGPEHANIGLARHWRALSYEVYTGRGWALADEEKITIDADGVIPLAAAKEVMLIEQDVNWRYDNRIIRYGLGLPLRFDQSVITSWRSDNDFVRAVSDGIPRYRVTTRVSAATPDQLRKAVLDEVPGDLLNRYTKVPGDMPRRVADLAQEVAGNAPTAYDQALTLEEFLRQYDYSLDIDLPPAGADPVDYFLFDLQKGYCDYYASAMVIMARTMGLPARIATGFLAQPEDENGVQTVRQIDAHSWAEVYFGGYGWVEFEPTGAFASPHDPLFLDSGPDDDLYRDSAETADPMPIPKRAPRKPFAWSLWAALFLIILLTAGMTWWLRKRPQASNEVLWAYGQLQKNASHLGHALPLSQTPDEFKAELFDRMDQFSDRPGTLRLVEAVKLPITKLTALFVKQQYSGGTVESPRSALSLWRRIRRPMWILRLNKRLHGKGKH